MQHLPGDLGGPSFVQTCSYRFCFISCQQFQKDKGSDMPPFDFQRKVCANGWFEPGQNQTNACCRRQKHARRPDWWWIRSFFCSNNTLTSTGYFHQMVISNCDQQASTLRKKWLGNSKHVLPILHPSTNWKTLGIKMVGREPIWVVVSNISFFTPIWGRFPFWLIFFKGVETTN